MDMFLVLLRLFKAIKIIKTMSSYSNFKGTTKNVFLLLFVSQSQILRYKTGTF